MSKRPAIAAILCLVTAFTLHSAPPGSQEDLRAASQKFNNEGNYRDALEGFQKLALAADDNPRLVGSDLQMVVNCLSQLDRVDEIDALREKVIAVHAKNWRLLQAAAQTLMNGEHFGFMVAGEFYRGHKRGGGEQVNSFDRDRVRALQLDQQAAALVKDEPDKKAVGVFLLEFASYWMSGRNGGTDSWQLQDLTDLTTLPDYEKGGYYFRGYGGGETRGAPVDEEGNPVYHKLPESYEKAASDGERWRSLLDRAAKTDPDLVNNVRWTFAEFLWNQFDVHTMRQYGFFFGRSVDDEDEKDAETAPFAVHTLKENETIARLATGIKRFTLPDEFNFIRIYRQIADSKQRLAEQSLGKLAEIFENRRQYPAAAEMWKRSIAEHGPGQNNYKKDRLNQIVGNWGRFDNAKVQPAGKGATVEYRFRNGRKVAFEAHRINVKKLLDDVKAYLKSNPQRLDWQTLNINDIGHRLVEQNQQQYLQERVAAWEVELKPREKHFDSQITVTTPLQQAGAYLLVGKMADGNTSRIILWLDDTVIVKKPLDGRVMYFVADAVTGAPLPKVNVEFFGYQQKNVGPNRFTVLVKDFAENTDADGQVFPDPKMLPSDYNWVVIATTRAGRLAHLGFDGVWYGQQYDYQYNRQKAFVMTDRPVYRPGQPVQFKFWIQNARYDEGQAVNFAGKSFTVRITNPKGENVLEKEFKCDEYGGFAGEFALPKDAALGSYGINTHEKHGLEGGGAFRVEEYKKPEYEVTVESPKEPVMLGEKITATVRAKYYFGAPVTKARVHYKVTRQNYAESWYPIGIWDWFYGPGYWWFAYDYVWYPGWKDWGCFRPVFAWWPRTTQPPEVVLDNEVPIGEDGTVPITIDTAVAKAVHADKDHRYQITAEVVDQSRRTIVGSGEVLVARKPFKVFGWVNRGYYRAGDTVEARFNAHTLDKKPIQGTGKLRLLKVTYDEKANPVETEVEAWDLNTDERGEATQKFVAAQEGQFRLSYTVTDKKEHAIEGGYVFTVIGDKFNGTQYRFSDIEVVADKREYKPGDKVRLLINTNRVGSTVVLFVRAENGICPRPLVLRLAGKSTVHEVAVVQKDMPNFFIEAFTISNGTLHSDVREIVVPPETRVTNVAVEASSKEYKPGASGRLQLKLTDGQGKPFVGSAVVTMYDKSVEYISGGSNIGDIREFFWKWRRNHHPQTESSLDRFFYNLLKRGEIPMGDLGVFGQIIEANDAGVMAGERTRGGGVMRGKSAMPMAAMARAKDGAARGEAGAEKADGAAAPPPTEQMAQPTVRKEFADTALWAAALVSDQNGIVEVPFKLPDNLTTWKIRTWTMTHGTRVGQGEAEVITTKNLLVRMQAPRFFTERDEVVLSANVHNYLKTPKAARVLLELDGKQLSPLVDLEQTATIPSGDEVRIDWRVKVAQAGEAIVRMKALTDEESDAVELRFPVYVHGMLKTDSYTGVIRPDGKTAKISVTVPGERQPEKTRLEVRYSPTLAGALVDALPYLVSSPYKTTDCTLTRFLPTVITQNILQRMHLDLKAIREKRTNLNAQEIGDDVARAQGWKRYDHNPVFDEAELDSLVKEGLAELTAMQLSDGGWGWFSGWGEHSDAHTTAFTVHGLQIARQNDVAIVPDVLERGVSWLKRYQTEQVNLLKKGREKNPVYPYKSHADNLDAFVFMVLADADVLDREMLDFLYADRNELSVYAKGLFGLALHKINDADKLTMIIRNIDQFLVQDEENQTAYIKGGGSWWYWYDSEVEANAYYLKLLAKTDPKGVKASRLVKYLLNNRKHATYWSSTRDTAIAIEALAEYLVASGESTPDMTVEVHVDGKKLKEVKITAENLFSFDNKLVLVGDALSSGVHTVELRRQGEGPLYFNAYLTNFTLEDHITRAGLELKVNRKYYKLIRDDKATSVAGSRGQVVKQRVEKYRREELVNLAMLKSGDLVEIELEIDSKNDYEHLVFEDMKAAGFEPVDLQSGYNPSGMGAYMELRDERVTFFARQLARGKHSISYRLRAEIPGRFSALPTRGFAMYAPELVGNSDEIKLLIED